MDEVQVDKLFHAGGPYDKNDKRSLYNIMPLICRKTVDEMPVSLLTMDEVHLEHSVRPTPYLNQLRTAFWQEYDAAQNSLTAMTVQGIQSHMGSKSPSMLLKEHLTQFKSLAWILVPPTHYDSLIDEALNRGMRRLQQILDLPMHKSDGEIDHKAIELIMKATAFLDIRKNGMPTQRTIQEVKQMNVHLTSRDVKSLGIHTRSDELDMKLRELEEKLKVEYNG